MVAATVALTRPCQRLLLGASVFDQTQRGGVGDALCAAGGSGLPELPSLGLVCAAFAGVVGPQRRVDLDQLGIVDASFCVIV